MASIEYSIKVKPLRIPKTVKKALQKGARYKVEFAQRKQRYATVLTPKIRIQQCDI